MKHFDAFAGIGGFTLALKNIYGEQYENVGFSEIDKHAIANYLYNFPNHISYGDITAIQPKDIGQVDIFTGGFPCQPFSTAGKRQGFEDTRGTMFFEIARLCRELKPKYVLLENVRGLLSHDNGRTFSIIYQTLVDIGYTIEFQVVNTKWFLPQNRERIYIVGHLTTCGGSICNVFPIGEDDETFNRKAREEGRERDCLQTSYSRTITSRIHKMGSGDTYIGTSKGIRRLTVIECERLQGFSDNWTQFGNYNGVIKEIANTNRYKVLGNAVSLPVVEEIVKRLVF